MVRNFTIAVAIALCLTSSGGSANLPVSRGQTPAEVRARLGTPPRVSRQILLGRHVEQWGYDDPQPFWVEFSCIRGEDPYACAILQLSPARP